MAIIVKGEITITKGFNTWKAMVKKNQTRMNDMGMVMLFAGVQKDDPTKLHAISHLRAMKMSPKIASGQTIAHETSALPNWDEALSKWAKEARKYHHHIE